MRFRLKVRNYRGLREINWSPEGVCALVGPNGSGKTTLLDVLALLRDALDRGLARALEEHGGIANARNVDALEGAPCDFEIGVQEIHWTLAPLQVAAGFRSAERVAHKQATIAEREGERIRRRSSASPPPPAMCRRYEWFVMEPAEPTLPVALGQPPSCRATP
jgi:predicted ATPase